MVWKDNIITKRLNGTYRVIHDGLPYQVTSRSVDSLNAYDIEEVAAFWDSLPEGDARKQSEKLPSLPSMKEIKVAKLAKMYGELEAIDRKIARPLAELVAGNASGDDKIKFDELMVRKNELRDLIAEFNAVETTEEMKTVSQKYNQWKETIA